MPITYEWRHYSDGDTPGAWLATTTLDDGAVNDLITSAGGITNPGGSANVDWQSADGNPFVHWFELKLTSDSPLSAGSITFARATKGTHGQVLSATWDVYGSKTGLDASIVGSGSGTTPPFSTDITDGLYNTIRLLYRFERSDTGDSLEVHPGIAFTDFRYVFVLLPDIVVGTDGNYRTRIRNGPGDTTTLWGPYQSTSALTDGPPPGSPGHPDHSTHCNMGTTPPASPPHSDIQVSFGGATILDLEGDLNLPGVLSLNKMTFSSVAGFSGTSSVPVCSYEVEVHTIEDDFIPVASGTTIQNAFQDLEFDIDPTLNVDTVRVTLHQERLISTDLNLSLDLYDISVFEATCITPSAPIDFVVTSHRDSSNPSAMIVDMTWGAPLTGDTPIEYFVYRVKEGTEAVDILVHVTTDLFSSVSTLSLDQNHCFYIVASNPCGVGPPSLIQCTSVSSVILGPTNFRDVGHCEGDKISLLWDLPPDVGGIGGFHIYRDGVLMANLANTVSTWVDLAPGIEVLHTYELRTMDLSGAEIGDMTLTLENVFACEWMDCTTENEAVEGEWTQILV